jgi:malate dehydrogenase (oxaloacetate-decarboxylating)(NADP+)
MDSGVARGRSPISTPIADRLERFVFRSGQLMQPVFEARAQTPSGSSIAEGEDERVLRARRRWSMTASPADPARPPDRISGWSDGAARRRTRRRGGCAPAHRRRRDAAARGQADAAICGGTGDWWRQISTSCRSSRAGRRSAASTRCPA